MINPRPTPRVTPRPTPAARRRSGFSLTEMLIVVGIIILLMAILLPAIRQAQISAKATRTRADLNSIAIALGEYRKDNNGAYPPSAGAGTGAAVLVKALCGIADANWSAPAHTSKLYSVGEFASAGGISYLCIDPGTGTTSAPTPTSPLWTAFSMADGADGPGWAVVNAGVKVRTVQPYLDAARFRADVQGLHDEQGRPILYMPARALGTNISVANGYLASGGGRYDADVIRPFFVRNGSSTPMGSEDLSSANPLRRMKVMLGDQDTDGGISTSAGENAVATGGFVLWAAGLDEAFGPVTSGGTMDANVITNRKLAQECDDLIHVNN